MLYHYKFDLQEHKNDDIRQPLFVRNEVIGKFTEVKSVINTEVYTI
jgi:hypothetical protein